MFLDAYRGNRVLLTGDTGFKGAWLALWLRNLGAKVYGLALPPEDDSALFVRTGLKGLIEHVDGDIRDLAGVEKAYKEVQPNIVFHLAAQALVRESYRDPVGTMMTNVMGTAHICDALRRHEGPCVLVIVTSDKCYENREWVYGYRENDPMGGSDPYSASKGAAEIVTSSWRHSFFPVEKISHHRKPIASVRAGNVIGPGDWAVDRIVPDCIRALRAGQAIGVRNPRAVRPWQHVLEPLSGYLWLGANLLSSAPDKFAGGWNFGPYPGSMRSVKDLVEHIIKAWGEGTWNSADETAPPPETNTLRLVIDKAVAQLGWLPVWNFSETIQHTVDGYRRMGERWDNAKAVLDVMEDEISCYVNSAGSAEVAWR